MDTRAASVPPRTTGRTTTAVWRDGVHFDVIVPSEIARSAGLPGQLSLSELGDVRRDGERIIARLSKEPDPNPSEPDPGASVDLATDYILVGTPTEVPKARRVRGRRG